MPAGTSGPPIYDPGAGISNNDFLNAPFSVTRLAFAFQTALKRAEANIIWSSGEKSRTSTTNEQYGEAVSRTLQSWGGAGTEEAPDGSAVDYMFGYPVYAWAPPMSITTIRMAAETYPGRYEGPTDITRNIFAGQGLDTDLGAILAGWKPSWEGKYQFSGSMVEIGATFTAIQNEIISEIEQWRKDKDRTHLQHLFWVAQRYPQAYIMAGEALVDRSGRAGQDIPFITSHQYLAQLFTWSELLWLGAYLHNKGMAASGKDGSVFTTGTLLPPQGLADPLGYQEITDSGLQATVDEWMKSWEHASALPGLSPETLADVGRIQREIMMAHRQKYQHTDDADPYPDWTNYVDELHAMLGSRVQGWDAQKDPEALRPVEDHEMRIGLCTFEVPPTSVNVTEKFSQLMAPVQSIRSAGNPKFSSGHSNTMITIRLVFPSFESMWGIPYEEAVAQGEALYGTGMINSRTIPEDEELDQELSSLRGLIAAFKASPFLPIKNKYLNETHKITAVTLLGMTMSTIEGFPHAIEVSLELLKFNFQVYIPHALDFNDCIFWGRYRYYLSKMLQQIEDYVSFSWIAQQHGDTVPIGNDGSRTLPWVRKDENGNVVWMSKDAQALKDIELFYVSEAVRPMDYPDVPYHDDLFYERAEAYLDETLEGQRQTKWQSLVSLFFGEQVYDINSTSLSKVLLDTSKSDPGMYDLLKSLLGADNDWRNLRYEHFDWLIEEYKKVVPRPEGEDVTDDDITAWETDISTRALETVLVYLAEGWLRSDDYKEWLEAALEESEYSSIYEWEVPMVPLYLDKNKVHVDSIGISFSNRIANLQLQLQDEPTHQHIGSGDTACQISLTIEGEEEIQKLSDMIDRVQALSRFERSNACLGFWGIKNFLTALAGMKYCLPQSITYNSVEGYPHLYKVMLDLVDFDVFQQKRESLSSAEYEELVEEFGKLNPFLRLKQNAKYFNCYPDLPLSVKDDEGKTMGYLEPDFYYVATMRETLRWVDEKTGGLANPYSMGDKSYPWPEIDCDLMSIPDTNHIASIRLTRYPSATGSTHLQIGVEDYISDQLKVQRREELIAEGYSAEEAEEKIKEEEIQWLTEQGVTNDVIEQFSRIDSDEVRRIYLPFLGETAKAINPDLVAVNPYFEQDISKNFDALLENLSISDLRGRMIRAFPTYYLLLIDEGGYIFSYKLFDNFYGLNSVIDFSVHASEDIIGDTLQLRLANFYGKLSTPVITGFNRLYYKGSVLNTKLEESYNQFVNLATKLGDRLGVPVLDKDKKIVWSALDHIELKPGVRVQLRSGYSTNINNLTVVFNGVVTEVSAGDIMTVTCQGDGIELLNVVNAGEKDGHTGSIDGAWLSGWDLSEPRDLIIELMTSGGSVIRQAIAAATAGGVMGDSRYGISHFGRVLWEPMTALESERQDSQLSAVDQAMQTYKSFLDIQDQIPLESQPGGMPHATTFWLLGEGDISEALKKAVAQMQLAPDKEVFKRNIYPGNGTGIMEMVGVDNLQTVGAALESMRGLSNLILGAESSTAGSIGTGIAGGPAGMLLNTLTDNQLSGYLSTGMGVGASIAGNLGGLLIPGFGLIGNAVGGIGLMGGGGVPGVAGGILMGLGHPVLGALVALVGSVGKYFVNRTLDYLTTAAQDAGIYDQSGGIMDILGLTDEDKSGPEDPFCEISMQLYTYQRTVWDLMLDCAALLPNYVVAVRPWENRSTLFYGKPHWMYTSGVWPVTSGTKIPPKIDQKILDALDALIKEIDDKDRYRQVSTALTTQGPTAATSPERGVTLENEDVTNWMAVDNAQNLAQWLTDRGYKGTDGLLSESADAFIKYGRENQINPALIVGMGARETEFGKNPQACCVNGSDHNHWGIKWEDWHSEFGRMGPLVPPGERSKDANGNYTPSSHYTTFNSAEASIQCAAIKLAKYVEGFVNGDPDYEKYNYYKRGEGSLLLSICSRWVGTGSAKTDYANDVSVIMADLKNKCGSGIDAADATTQQAISDLESVDPLVMFALDDKSLRELATLAMGPLHTVFVENQAFANKISLTSSPLLQFLVQYPDWCSGSAFERIYGGWKPVEWLTNTFLVDMFPDPGRSTQAPDNQWWFPHVPETLMIILKYNTIKTEFLDEFKTSDGPWETAQYIDQLARVAGQDPDNPSFEGMSSGIVPVEAIEAWYRQGAELREELFPEKVRILLANKHKYSWPKSVEEINMLIGTDEMWEHFGLPCDLDIIDTWNPFPANDDLKEDKGFWSSLLDIGVKALKSITTLGAVSLIMEKAVGSIQSLTREDGPVINKAMASIWSMRSLSHCCQLHEFYDSEMFGIIPLAEGASSELKCPPYAAYMVFRELFFCGRRSWDATGKEPNTTGYEWLWLWDDTDKLSYDDYRYSWTRLLLNVWMKGDRRPAIMDTIQSFVENGQYGKDFFKQTTQDVTSSNPWSNISGSAMTNKTMKDRAAKASALCQTIGLTEGWFKLLAFICIWWEEIIYDTREAILTNHFFNENWEIVWAVNLLMVLRACEECLDPRAFHLQGGLDMAWGNGDLLNYISQSDIYKPEKYRALFERAMGPEAGEIIGVISESWSSEGENPWEMYFNTQYGPKETSHDVMHELGPIIFTMAQTALVCMYPALYLPYSRAAAGDLGSGGMYLPVCPIPIFAPPSLYYGDDDDFSLAPSGSRGIDMGLLSMGINMLANSRESRVFEKHSPRAVFRNFMSDVININDWAIAWVATTANIDGNGIRDWVYRVVKIAVPAFMEGLSGGQNFDKPICFQALCEATAAYIDGGYSRDAAYQWMFDHQDPGDHSAYALVNAIESVLQKAFGFIEDILKKLWGLATMGSAQFGAGLSVARFMSNFSNILNAAYNDSLYYVEGALDNPYTREYGEPVLEIREPFQKFWMIDSFSDIIDNQIVCSSENVYTVCTAVSGGGHPQTVYADRSIYPENQKEKVVETNLRWEDPKWYEIIDNIIEAFRQNYLLNKGCPYDVQAKRVACHHLKESLKDMYGGEIFILGRPEIRPHDIVYLCDLYENICGLVEVEAVTHHFSAESGFITAITPNALVAVDDPGKWCFATQLKAAADLQLAHKSVLYSTQGMKVELFGRRGSGGGYVEDQQQSIEEALGAYKGGWADWLYNVSQGNPPSTREILDSMLNPVGGGQIYATCGHGVTQSMMDTAITFFVNHAMVQTQAWFKKKEICVGAIPFVGGWIANLFGMVDRGITWFQENFIDYHPVSMFPLLKKGEPWLAGVGGHAGLVVGTPEYKSVLPGLLGGLLDIKTGDFIKPYDVLGRLGYTSTDSLELIRTVNIFHADAVGRARIMSGKVETGEMAVGIEAQYIRATIMTEFNEYQKGVIDGDTFWCSINNHADKVRLAMVDAAEYHPKWDPIRKTWVPNEDLGPYADHLGIEHQVELGGLEAWYKFLRLLPAPGNDVWLVVNPYNERDHDRIIARVYDCAAFPDEDAVKAAHWRQSINWVLYTALMADPGYGIKLTGDVSEYPSEVVGK